MKYNLIMREGDLLKSGVLGHDLEDTVMTLEKAVGQRKAKCAVLERS